MCSIGGCYKKDGIKADDVHEIIEMAKRGVCRGRDATGFMIPNGWWKIAEMSPIAVEKSGFADWLEQNDVWGGNLKWVMFHTRAKTRGSPRVSSNNHPLVHGRDEYGVKLIHNGFIRKPDYYGYDVVDTRNAVYLINRLRKEGMSLIEATRTAMHTMEGRIALVSTDRYGLEFVVMKDDNDGGSPVFYWWNKRQDRIQFASTKEIAGDSFIGIVGRKQNYHNVVGYELGDYQALWWNGEDDTTLKRVWHDERHGGEDEFIRSKLPNRVNIKDYKPLNFEDGGKFSLRHNYGYRSYTDTTRKNRRDKRRGGNDKNWTRDVVEDNGQPLYMPDSIYDYFEVSDIERADPPTNIIIYPQNVPAIDDRGKSWYGFPDANWARSLRAEVVKLQSTGEFASILRHDVEGHIMWIIMSDNRTRKYFRSKRKSKLAYVDY